MAFEQLQAHVSGLGGIQRLDGGEPRPLTDADQNALSGLLGAPLPAALSWWFATYGGGIRFAEPVVYVDPREHVEVVLGHFLDADEIRQVLDDSEGVMAPHRIPIHDDEVGNFLVVDAAGAVFEHIHDAPTDRNSFRIADSFEKFVLMLRRGT